MASVFPLPSSRTPSRGPCRSAPVTGARPAPGTGPPRPIPAAPTARPHDRDSKNCHVRQVAHRLLQQLHPLADELDRQEGRAGDVAAGTREAGHDAGLRRVRAHAEQDRGGPGRLLDQPDHRALAHEQVHLLAQQLFREGKGALRRPLAPPGLEDVALALDLAGLAQALAKAIQVHGGPGRGAARDPSDPGRLPRRLRADAGAGGEKAKRKAAAERATRDQAGHGCLHSIVESRPWQRPRASTSTRTSSPSAS